MRRGWPDAPALPHRATPDRKTGFDETSSPGSPLPARFLNVSPNTVESWEQVVRQPDQAALKLLTIAKKHPQAVLSA